MAVNYLKNSEAQNKVLTIAFGKVNITGHIYCAKITGASPTHQITAYNLLGEGEYNACLGAFWKGNNITSANYVFQKGALATAMLSGNQQVNSLFPLDVPHSRTAAIAYKIPTGLGDANIESTAPTGFEGVFEAKLCPDFDSDGDETDFSYTTNPARQIVELLKTYARMPNLPSLYASAAEYWLSRVDWGNWTDFRDFHDQTETVDYTQIPDFQGFGLTASFYNGTNFNTFVRSFVQPSINYPSSSTAPAMGVTPGSFSARFEGFIRAKYSETMTFHATHDNGVRVFIAPVGAGYGAATIDQWNTSGTTTPGTHTGNYAMTAGTFYQIRIDWNDGGSSSQLKLEWSSTSQTQEVIPSKNLYPKPENHKLYESNIWIETPRSPGAAMDRILFHTNSIRQDVNGKLRFFCLDELTTPSFTFDNSNIDKFEFRRKDILKADPITSYEAQFKDLDLEYPNEPDTPISLELDTFSRKSIENVKIINLYNCTRWQARKVIAMRARLENSNDLIADMQSTVSKSYPVMPGNLVSIQHRKIGETARNYLIKSAVDKGISEAQRAQGKLIENRTFVVQEWE